MFCKCTYRSYTFVRIRHFCRVLCDVTFIVRSAYNTVINNVIRINWLSGISLLGNGASHTNSYNKFFPIHTLIPGNVCLHSIDTTCGAAQAALMDYLGMYVKIEWKMFAFSLSKYQRRKYVE